MDLMGILTVVSMTATNSTVHILLSYAKYFNNLFKALLGKMYTEKCKFLTWYLNLDNVKLQFNYALRYRFNVLANYERILFI